MIKEYKITDKEFNFFEDEKEFYATTGAVKRSNCCLSNEKLSEAGINMRPVQDAIVDSLKNWQ